MRITFLTLLLIFFSQILYSQGKVVYTFEKCMQQAMDENVDLKIRKNYEKKVLLNRMKHQWSLAPSLNGWGNSSLNFRRSTNQNNEISSGSSYHTSYGLSGSLTLFGGFTKLNLIAANRYNELVFSQSTSQAKNSLYIEVLEKYTTALFQKSMVDIFEEKVEISMAERARIGALVESGLIEEVAILEIEAMVSNNRLLYNQAQNNYEHSIIQLTQLIEFDDYKNFEIDEEDFQILIPKETNYTFENLFNLACENLPQIKQKEYKIEFLKKLMKVTKGNGLPTLSVHGGYRAHFYSTDTIVNGNISPFTEQFSDYLNPNLEISLSIPIFNKMSQSIAIKSSQIDIENGIFELEIEKKMIKNEIIEAIQRLESYQIEYASAKNNLNYVDKSFKGYREKFQLGIITSTDFMTAQNQLAVAKANVVRSKFNWIVQNSLLNLYTGLVNFN